MIYSNLGINIRNYFCKIHLPVIAKWSNQTHLTALSSLKMYEITHLLKLQQKYAKFQNESVNNLDRHYI